MTDLDLAVSITDGALSDLALTRANGYRIVRGSLGPGARLWKRQTVESPFVHDRVLVGAVLMATTAPLGVRVFASTSAGFETRLQALMDRMEQLSYVLEVVIDSVTYRWQCETADSAVGNTTPGAFDEFEMAAIQQVIRFTVPRSTVPLDGPL